VLHQSIIFNYGKIICRKFAFGHEIYAEVQQNIMKLREVYNLKCLRIIICWAGFTKSQIATMNAHNKKYVEDPILLICPSNEETGQKLYTKNVYTYLLRTMDLYSRFKVEKESISFNLADLTTTFEKSKKEFKKIKKTQKMENNDSESDTEETTLKENLKKSSIKIETMEKGDSESNTREITLRKLKKTKEKVKFLNENSKKRKNIEKELLKKTSKKFKR
jgi:HD superfamily phosphohydrolase